MTNSNGPRQMEFNMSSFFENVMEMDSSQIVTESLILRILKMGEPIFKRASCNPEQFDNIFTG